VREISAAAVLIAVAVAVVVFRRRLGPDFLPPDDSRVGPNLIASVITWAVLLVVGVLLWPPTRRALHRALDAKLAVLHGHHRATAARQDQHNEWMARQVAHLHEAITGERPEPHPLYDVHQTKGDA